MNSETTNHWSEQELSLIEEAKKYPQLCAFGNGGKEIKNAIWSLISNKLNIPASVCRSKWLNITSGYLKTIDFENPSNRSKYLDGRLSFLEKYYNNKTKSNPAKEQDVVTKKSDDEEGDEKYYHILDLQMVDDLLAKRGPHEQVIEMSKMEDTLSLVAIRIKETIASYRQHNKTQEAEPQTNNGTNAQTPAPETSISPDCIEIENPADVIDLVYDDDDANHESDLQLSAEEPIETLPHVIHAFPPSEKKTSVIESSPNIPTATMTIPMEEKAIDDMETIFDIHSKSDSESFFKEVGRYLERFSKEKQDLIRLKICYLVTEAELEEME